MSEQEKQAAAKEHLERSRRQVRHAGKNATKAAQLAGAVAAEEGKDIVHHTAEETKDVVEESAKKAAARAAERYERGINSLGLVSIATDATIGFCFLTLSIATGAAAFHKFGTVGAALASRRMMVR